MELIKFGEVNYMNKSVILELKKVIFTESEIIVKNKKEDVIILYNNIKYTSYHKKNFINYLLIYGLDVAPGWLLIKFKEKISNRKAIMFKIDYKDLMKLPKKILEILEINQYSFNKKNQNICHFFYTNPPELSFLFCQKVDV